MQGNLGSSFFSKQPVLLMIEQRLPLTLILMGTAEVFIIIVSLILGLVAAVKQYSLTDNLITSFSFIGYSMPIFFIALGCIEIFAVQFKSLGSALPADRCGHLGSQRSRATGEASDFAGLLPGGHPDRRLLPLPALQHPGSAGPGLRPHGTCQGSEPARGTLQACLAQRHPALRDHRRSRHPVPAGRCPGDRIGLCLARAWAACSGNMPNAATIRWCWACFF